MKKNIFLLLSIVSSLAFSNVNNSEQEEFNKKIKTLTKELTQPYQPEKLDFASTVDKLTSEVLVNTFFPALEKEKKAMVKKLKAHFPKKDFSVCFTKKYLEHEFNNTFKRENNLLFCDVIQESLNARQLYSKRERDALFEHLHDHYVSGEDYVYQVPHLAFNAHFNKDKTKQQFEQKIKTFKEEMEQYYKKNTALSSTFSFPSTFDFSTLDEESQVFLVQRQDEIIELLSFYRSFDKNSAFYVYQKPLAIFPNQDAIPISLFLSNGDYASRRLNDDVHYALLNLHNNGLLATKESKVLLTHISNVYGNAEISYFNRLPQNGFTIVSKALYALSPIETKNRWRLVQDWHFDLIFNQSNKRLNLPSVKWLKDKSIPPNELFKKITYFKEKEYESIALVKFFTSLGKKRSLPMAIIGQHFMMDDFYFEDKSIKLIQYLLLLEKLDKIGLIKINHDNEDIFTDLSIQSINFETIKFILRNLAN